MNKNYIPEIQNRLKQQQNHALDEGMKNWDEIDAENQGKAKMMLDNVNANKTPIF